MANRLVECHRVLKPTGSIYLHWDPTMSHYLKTVMDGIFGKADVEFIGMPKTRDVARFMAGSDPFRFERWAASLVDGMEANKKQRGDGGIDGRGRLQVRRGQFIDIVSPSEGREDRRR